MIVTNRIRLIDCPPTKNVATLYKGAAFQLLCKAVKFFTTRNAQAFRTDAATYSNFIDNFAASIGSSVHA